MTDLFQFAGISWLVVIAWLLGWIIVVGFSKTYFDGESYFLERPQTGRTSFAPDFTSPVPPGFATNQARYHFWFLAFLGVTSALYILVAMALSKLQPERIRELIKGDGAEGLQLEMLSIYPQILSALMLSGLLPGLPFISDVLKKIRAWLHERALIPSAAQVVYQDLLSQKFPITPEERARVIEFVGAQSLKSEDFDFLNDDPWYKWAKTCQLMAVINTLARNHLVYKRNLARAELRYELVKLNFDSVKEQIVKNRSDPALPPLVEYLVDKLAKQVAQLTACLICSSEEGDEEVNVRLSKLGVPRPSSRRYTVHLARVVLFSVPFTVLVFFVALAVQSVLERHGLWVATDFDGVLAFKVSVSAMALVYIPVLIVYLLKVALINGDRWKVRGQFSERHYWPQALTVGVSVIYGLVILYAIHEIELFEYDPDWERTLIYSILAGLSGWMTTLAIDRKLRINPPIRKIVLSALIWAPIGAGAFFVAGLICVTVQQRLGLSLGELRTNAAGLWLLIVIPFEGALIGAMVSVLADRCLSAVGTRSTLILNLREYLLPLFDLDRLGSREIQELNAIFPDKVDELPDKFLDYLRGKGLVNGENKLTADGMKYVKRAAI